MSKQSETDSDHTRPVQKETIGRRKRPYHTPRLVTYGNLRELALAKGGPNADGPGNPHSKL